MLEEAVREVADGLRERGLSFEIVVVENGSTDDTAAIANRLAGEPRGAGAVAARTRLRPGAAGRDPRRRGGRGRELRRSTSTTSVSSTGRSRWSSRPTDRRWSSARSGRRAPTTPALAAAPGHGRVLDAAAGRLRAVGVGHPRREGDAPGGGGSPGPALPLRPGPLRHRAVLRADRGGLGPVELSVIVVSGGRRAPPDRGPGAPDRAGPAAHAHPPLARSPGARHPWRGHRSPVASVGWTRPRAGATPRRCRVIRSPPTRWARRPGRSSRRSRATTPTCWCASCRRTSPAPATTSRHAVGHPRPRGAARHDRGTGVTGGQREVEDARYLDVVASLPGATVTPVSLPPDPAGRATWPRSPRACPPTPPSCAWPTRTAWPSTGCSPRGPRRTRVSP